MDKIRKQMAYEVGRERGYLDGLDAGRRERVERLELQLADLQYRYDGLIKHFTSIEMMKPPAPIIIKSDPPIIPEENSGE